MIGQYKSKNIPALDYPRPVHKTLQTVDRSKYAVRFLFHFYRVMIFLRKYILNRRKQKSRLFTIRYLFIFHDAKAQGSGERPHGHLSQAHPNATAYES